MIWQVISINIIYLQKEKISLIVPLIFRIQGEESMLKRHNSSFTKSIRNVTQLNGKDKIL